MTASRKSILVLTIMLGSLLRASGQTVLGERLTNHVFR
jgi:hydrogenase maturation factor HypE